MMQILMHLMRCHLHTHMSLSAAVSITVLETHPYPAAISAVQQALMHLLCAVLA